VVRSAVGLELELPAVRGQRLRAHRRRARHAPRQWSVELAQLGLAQLSAVAPLLRRRGGPGLVHLILAVPAQSQLRARLPRACKGP
jgi:hypothetical protein